jgi:hypothetical protein
MRIQGLLRALKQNIQYDGPQTGALKWIADIGYPMQSAYGNPADYLLDIISVDPRPCNANESLERVQFLAMQWPRIRTQSSQKLTNWHDRPGTLRQKGRSPVFTIVLHRMLVNLWRQPDRFWIRLIQTPCVSLIYLFAMRRLGAGPSAGQDRIGITVQNASAITFSGLIVAIAIYPAEKTLFLHERASSARYSCAAFLVAYTLIELPLEWIGCLCYSLVIGYGIGVYPEVKTCFELAVTIWAQTSFGESAGIIFITFANKVGLSVSLVSTMLSISCFVAGIQSLSLPSWLAAVSSRFGLLL